MEQAHLCIEAGYVIERENRKHKIVSVSVKFVQIVVLKEAVITGGFECLCLRDHLRRNVHTDYMESEPSCKSGRAPRAAPKTKCIGSFDVLADDLREAAVCQIIGLRELKLGVSLSPSAVFIAVAENSLYKAPSCSQSVDESTP